MSEKQFLKPQELSTKLLTLCQTLRWNFVWKIRAWKKVWIEKQHNLTHFPLKIRQFLQRFCIFEKNDCDKNFSSAIRFSPRNVTVCQIPNYKLWITDFYYMPHLELNFFRKDQILNIFMDCKNHVLIHFSPEKRHLQHFVCVFKMNGSDGNFPEKECVSELKLLKHVR